MAAESIYFHFGPLRVRRSGLKRYDFVLAGHDWSAVGSGSYAGGRKNMVASIRYWMRSFGLVDGDGLTKCAFFINRGARRHQTLYGRI